MPRASTPRCYGKTLPPGSVSPDITAFAVLDKSGGRQIFHERMEPFFELCFGLLGLASGYKLRLRTIPRLSERVVQPADYDPDSDEKNQTYDV